MNIKYAIASVAVIIAIILVSFLGYSASEEITPSVKTEKELAVERINERNIKIAPVSDACIKLEELKRANEADLKILFGK